MAADEIDSRFGGFARRGHNLLLEGRNLIVVIARSVCGEAIQFFAKEWIASLRSQ
jgi:hypothetical protein